MKPAKLVEIREENMVHDLTKLLSEKPEITVGRRNPRPGANQADILLGEKGEIAISVEALSSISRKHAVIGYDAQTDTYYIQDCSRHGTIILSKTDTPHNEDITNSLDKTELGYAKSEKLNREERRTLQNGNELFFGGRWYGPVIFLQES